MSGGKGFFMAVIGLGLLEAVVSSKTATSNAAGLLALPAAFVKDLTDPSVTLWGSPNANAAQPSTNVTAGAATATSGSAGSLAGTAGNLLGPLIAAQAATASTSTGTAPATLAGLTLDTNPTP